MEKENAVEYWVLEASKGRNVAECWQAIYAIIQKQKDKIYTDLLKIADANEEEFMRNEGFFLNYRDKK